MGVNTTLLGPGSSLTPGNFRGVEIFASPHFFLPIAHSLGELFNYFLVCSGLPLWKQLISHSISTHECISLITSIFSDNNEVEAVEHLSGNDAQAFIDLIDGVSTCIISSGCRLVDPHQSFLVLSARDWIVSNRISAGSVCAPHIGFVAAKPCFQDLWRSHSVMTQRRLRWPTVGLRMCGKVIMMAERSQSRSRGYAQRRTFAGFEESVSLPPVMYIDGPTVSRTEVLQGGCGLELPPPSERITAVGRGDVWG